MSYILSGKGFVRYTKIHTEKKKKLKLYSMSILQTEKLQKKKKKKTTCKYLSGK